jgi:hypothetical protein
LHDDVGDCCKSERRSVHGARALVASRQAGVAAFVAVVKAKRRGEAAPPSYRCAVRAILFPPTCLRRMHLCLTLQDSEPALARLSPLIDFEIISANPHP